MGRLDGQVAIVTGAGSGIGRSTALAYARAGCRVALLGRRPEPLQEVADLTGGLPLAADVSDEADVARAVDAVLQAWGRVDVLVNNAGLNVAGRHLPDVAPADFRTVLEVNLVGTFLVTQAVLPTMRAQGSGTVLNVSSIAGHRPMALTGPAYSAAKAGVNAFTDSLNLSERAHGIRATAVCPGEVATPILDKRPVPPSAEAREAMLQPDDLAEVLLFLATLHPRAAVELLTLTPTVRREGAV